MARKRRSKAEIVREEKRRAARRDKAATPAAKKKAPAKKKATAKKTVAKKGNKFVVKRKPAKKPAKKSAKPKPMKADITSILSDYSAGIQDGADANSSPARTAGHGLVRAVEVASELGRRNYAKSKPSKGLSASTQVEATVELAPLVAHIAERRKTLQALTPEPNQVASIPESERKRIVSIAEQEALVAHQIQYANARAEDDAPVFGSNQLSEVSKIVGAAKVTIERLSMDKFTERVVKSTQPLTKKQQEKRDESDKIKARLEEGIKDRELNSMRAQDHARLAHPGRNKKGYKGPVIESHLNDTIASQMKGKEDKTRRHRQDYLFEYEGVPIGSLNADANEGARAHSGRVPSANRVGTKLIKGAQLLGSEVVSVHASTKVTEAMKSIHAAPAHLTKAMNARSEAWTEIDALNTEHAHLENRIEGLRTALKVEAVEEDDPTHRTEAELSEQVAGIKAKMNKKFANELELLDAAQAKLDASKEIKVSSRTARLAKAAEVKKHQDKIDNLKVSMPEHHKGRLQRLDDMHSRILAIEKTQVGLQNNFRKRQTAIDEIQSRLDKAKHVVEHHALVVKLKDGRKVRVSPHSFNAMAQSKAALQAERDHQAGLASRAMAAAKSVDASDRTKSSSGLEDYVNDEQRVKKHVNEFSEDVSRMVRGSLIGGGKAGQKVRKKKPVKKKGGQIKVRASKDGKTKAHTRKKATKKKVSKKTTTRKKKS